MPSHLDPRQIVMTGFLIGAVIGFKSSPWVVDGALAGHGVLDASGSRFLHQGVASPDSRRDLSRGDADEPRQRLATSRRCVMNVREVLLVLP